MPGCPYFLANTFAHLLGGLIVTGISTEYPFIPDFDGNMISHIFASIMAFVLLLVVLFSNPGPFKYIVCIAVCVIFGQILAGFVKRLKMKQTLLRTLVLVGTVFLTMTVIGIFDKGNMLSWGSYLFAGLLGLIVASFALLFMNKDSNEAAVVSQWLHWGIVLLFTLFIGYDVQVLQEHAKLCTSNPDYVQESLNLYLDILNIFQGIGNSDI